MFYIEAIISSSKTSLKFTNEHWAILGNLFHIEAVLRVRVNYKECSGFKIRHYAFISQNGFIKWVSNVCVVMFLVISYRVKPNAEYDMFYVEIK